jgi:hypothetical protein
MDMADNRDRMEIVEISDDEARGHLKETYADPEAAGRFFDELIQARGSALDRLAEELKGDEDLAEHFARNPVEFLHKRKLIGPLDQITLDGLRNPWVDWPFPWPICRIRCNIEIDYHTHWVCIGFWPLRLCWPVVHIHFRWVCRIVCD